MFLGRVLHEVTLSESICYANKDLVEREQGPGREVAVQPAVSGCGQRLQDIVGLLGARVM